MLVERWTYNSSNESYKKTTYLLQDSKHWKNEIILSKVLLMKKIKLPLEARMHLNRGKKILVAWWPIKNLKVLLGKLGDSKTS